MCTAVRVDVWLLPLQPSQCAAEGVAEGAADAAADGDTAGLDALEQSRARRLRSAVHRQQFVAAHALQRVVLARCAGMAPHQLPLVAGPSGKPLPIRLPDGGWLHHNLSHSGGWMLLAASRGGPVGVDIEQVQPRGPLDDLVRLVFSARELQCWRTVPAAQHALAFHAGWTQKEAWLKAHGLGLGHQADGGEVSFRLGAHPVPGASAGGRAHGLVSGLTWCVPAAGPRVPLVATVVAPGRGSSIRVWHAVDAAAPAPAPMPCRMPPSTV